MCCVQHRLWSAFCVFVFIGIASDVCVICILNVAVVQIFQAPVLPSSFSFSILCLSIFSRLKAILSSLPFCLAINAVPEYWILHFCYYVIHSLFRIYGLNMLNAECAECESECNCVLNWYYMSVLVAGCPVKCGERIFYLNNVSNLKEPCVTRQPSSEKKKKIKPKIFYCFPNDCHSNKKKQKWTNFNRFFLFEFSTSKSWFAVNQKKMLHSNAIFW